MKQMEMVGNKKVRFTRSAIKVNAFKMHGIDLFAHLQALHIFPQHDAIQRLIGRNIDFIIVIDIHIITIITIVFIIVTAVNVSNAPRETAARRQPPLGGNQPFASQPTLCSKPQNIHT